MDFGDVGCEQVDWVYLVYYRDDHWWDIFVNGKTLLCNMDGGNIVSC